MARKKVRLEYITNKKTRLDALKKRSKGLKKKVGDLAILCKAKACVLIYPEGKSVPQVISSHDEAVGILSRFWIMEDDDPLNKKMDRECFLKKYAGKVEKEVLKCERESKESEIRLLLHKAMMVGHAGLSMEELTKVGCNLDVFLKNIHDRRTKIRGQPALYQSSQAQAPTTNFTGGMNTIGDLPMYQAQMPTPYITGDMGVIGAPTTYKAHAPPPYVTGGMDTIGAPTVYKAQVLSPYITGAMDTIGSQMVYQAEAPTHNVTNGMDTIGAPMVYKAPVPPQQHDEWLELMRSGGGDLGVPICSCFNDDASLNSIAGLNVNEMMHPFDLGAGFGHTWGGAGLGPSSSAFPPM